MEMKERDDLIRKLEKERNDLIEESNKVVKTLKRP